jgi:hypothetical protein
MDEKTRRFAPGAQAICYGLINRGGFSRSCADKDTLFDMGHST